MTNHPQERKEAMSNPKYIGSPTTKLIEECSELIHILCKAERFGWDNYHPDDEAHTTNRFLVLSEIKDVEKRIKELKKQIFSTEVKR